MPLRARLTRRDKSIDLELADYQLEPPGDSAAPCR
jgi:hypothetical protein